MNESQKFLLNYINHQGTLQGIFTKNIYGIFQWVGFFIVNETYIRVV